MRGEVRGPDFLVVEGPIGVGKTTLVKRLAERLGHTPLLEAAEENPFLPRFYREGHRAAFATQFYQCFLLDDLPIGEALRRARLHFLQEHNNPLGLAYALFGSAHYQAR